MKRMIALAAVLALSLTACANTASGTRGGSDAFHGNVSTTTNGRVNGTNATLGSGGTSGTAGSGSAGSHARNTDAMGAGMRR